MSSYDVYSTESFGLHQTDVHHALRRLYLTARTGLLPIFNAYLDTEISDLTTLYGVTAKSEILSTWVAKMERRRAFRI